MYKRSGRGAAFRWGKGYLTLDRFMSGRFSSLFGWTLVLSVFFFFLLWAIFGWLVGWNPGEAFIQLTNPSVKSIEDATLLEWIGVVVVNLFGLFVLNGVVLTLLVNWVSNRRSRFSKGEARYDSIFSHSYSVIIGGHQVAVSLARDLMSNGLSEYVVIQTRRKPDDLRREIAAEITNENIACRIIIYSGDRTSQHQLKELHLDCAREIYIVGEPFNIDGTSHDAMNMSTWKLINSMYDVRYENRIPCHVMFEFQSSFSAFQYTDLKIEDSRSFRFIPFSLYGNWAQQVLIDSGKNGIPYYMPLDGEGLSYSSPQRVHLVVVGMSSMGMALAIEAAHIAHYPNFNNPLVGRPRTLITFIDRNARREMLYMMGRFKELFQLARWRYIKAPDCIIPPDDTSWDIYDTASHISRREFDDPYRWHDPVNDADLRSPYYGGFLGDDLVDIDFEFIEGDVALPAIQRYIADACADENAKTTIAVCIPVAVKAMSVALYFDPSVYDNVQQIWVQQSESGALVDAVTYGLTGKDDAKFRALRPFGMVGQCDYLSRINSLLPRLVAYAYDCMDRGTTLAEEYGRLSIEALVAQVDRHWAGITSDGGKSSTAKRWSNIYCANSIDSKIRATGIDRLAVDDSRYDEAICSLARVEHNRWVLEQLLLGVRPVDKSYAGKLPVEDKATRTKLKSRNIHPDLISNDKLGFTQVYDEGIARIIPLVISIAREAGKR